MIKDRNTLVAALRQRGVDYLAPGDAILGEPVDDETLIASLVCQEDPRLRQAVIALLLLHPPLASIVPGLRGRLAREASLRLVTLYTAAVYLQRMWRVRLGHYLDASLELPDHFSRELGLPEPGAGHGKIGLHALAEWQAARSTEPSNYLSEYDGVVELVFQSLELQAARHESEKRS